MTDAQRPLSPVLTAYPHLELRRSSVISVSGVGVDAQQEVDGEETETDTDDDNDNEQIADGMRTLEGAEDGCELTTSMNFSSFCAPAQS